MTDTTIVAKYIVWDDIFSELAKMINERYRGLGVWEQPDSRKPVVLKQYNS